VSSHREAPEISKDPVADSADLYAFRSPDQPDTVTLIADYVPLQAPAAGPNFYEFGDDVLYQIHISHSGHSAADIVYSFTFSTTVTNPNTFLYNVGPIAALDDANWVRRQTYTVSRTDKKGTVVLGKGLASPPVNIGPRSTPDYAALAAAAVHELPGERQVFAGQRRDPFFVDLGSVFDLGALRPFQSLHLLAPKDTAAGRDSLANSNVHSIALRLPISEVIGGGYSPTGPADPRAVIGVWTTASRRKSRVFDSTRGRFVGLGPWVQVSRLGNPLVNELLIPMASKDLWNKRSPLNDKSYLAHYQRPELAALLPVLYPGDTFKNLAALNATKAARADLVATLLTGIPDGVVAKGLATFTGATPMDKLRLNVATPVTAKPDKMGPLAGDLAGYPNGRRLTDDVVAISLQAVAGALYGAIDKTYTPDAAATLVNDGTSAPAGLATFPYVPTPLSGYDVPAA
jgi:hypothetical protein